MTITPVRWVKKRTADRCHGHIFPCCTPPPLPEISEPCAVPISMHMADSIFFLKTGKTWILNSRDPKISKEIQKKLKIKADFISAACHWSSMFRHLSRERSPPTRCKFPATKHRLLDTEEVHARDERSLKCWFRDLHSIWWPRRLGVVCSPPVDGSAAWNCGHWWHLSRVPVVNYGRTHTYGVLPILDQVCYSIVPFLVGSLHPWQNFLLKNPEYLASRSIKLSFHASYQLMN